ncbi:hypothetical protein [Pseudokineococcus lusitanus]|uniref:Uncharacterized protein n=1 Tax=Pseudokineococcus lusitanus TaxID=763993 RepID=A0A3N1HU07_9ACTN|nr:hypothetical protein [Pseudokineococcus lusitanus]ROP45949.1 hypothetical protein EDC03_0565 [Pseudokineococcus lusitanus]
MPRLLDSGILRYQWVPGTAGLSTPAAPKVSDLTAGTTADITPLCVAGATSVVAAASDTNDEKSLADTGNGQTPTFDNYSGNLTLFRDFDDLAVATDEDPLELFPRKGIYGWIVTRVGPPRATAFATGQVVSAFLFCTDNPIDLATNQSGAVKIQVPLLPQGQMHQFKKLVA